MDGAGNGLPKGGHFAEERPARAADLDPNHAAQPLQDTHSGKFAGRFLDEGQSHP